MKYAGTGHTDIGLQRKRNEDHMLIDNSLGLYIVADGIGGYSAGDVAARLAVETVARYIYRRRALLEAARAAGGDEAQLSSLAADAVAEASKEVYQIASTDCRLAGMGCTLTLLLLGRQVAVMAHVGDSRLYLLRGGRARQLSTDHNVASELAELGVLGRSQIASARFGHVLTRSIGRRESVVVEELLIDVEAGDRFVLCTDGLTRYLASEQDLHTLLAGDPEARTLQRSFLPERPVAGSARQLVDFANFAGGADNVTAIVVQVNSVKPEAEVADLAALPLGVNLEADVTPASELARAMIDSNRDHARKTSGSIGSYDS